MSIPGTDTTLGPRLRTIAVGIMLTAFGVVATGVVGFGVGIVVGAFGRPDILLEPRSYPVLSIAIIGLTTLGNVIPAGIYLWYHDRTELHFETLSGDDYVVTAGTVLLSLVVGLGVFGAIRFSSLTLQTTVLAGGRSILGLVVFAVLSIVLIAPAEELLFRGTIQTRLRKHLGDYASAGLGGLLFGSVHLANWTGDPVAVVLGVGAISLIGALFGYAYLETRNVLTPIAAHGLYNTLLAVVSFVAF